MGPHITRRAMMLGAGASLLTASIGQSQSMTPLKDLRAGIQIGSYYQPWSKPDVEALIAYHCDIIAPEWGLKPNNVMKTKGTHLFRDADEIMKYANAHDLEVLGSSLYVPNLKFPWLDIDDYEAVKKVYGDYIKAMARGYPEVETWDVLKSVTAISKKFVKDPVLERYGNEFVAYLLRTANEAAPHAKFMISEFSLSCRAKWCMKKQRTLFGQIRELRRLGARIDVVGIQGRLNTRYKPSPANTARFIRKLSKIGVEAQITDLDVNDRELTSVISKRDEIVAEYYYDFLTRVLREENLTRIVFAGMTDRTSWMRRVKPQGKRSDGSLARPCLFDENLAPKPAYWATVEAFTHVRKPILKRLIGLG
ncbi:MAG: endo-1,4-beta-xylanase [Halocynthiibacter sp.]